MEGHRYADEEPNWYSGPQYARSAEPDVSGSQVTSTSYDPETDRPSGAFRLPEQRPANPYSATDPLNSAGGLGGLGFPAEAEPAHGYESGRTPVRGPEYPPVRPKFESDPASAAPVPSEMPPPASAPTGTPAADEPTGLVPPVQTERSEAPRAGDGVYRTRRPVSLVVVIVAIVILMIPVVRLLVSATFTTHPAAADIVSSVLLTLGLAMAGVGLFAIVGGGPAGRDVWLRPPAAFLPAGLILLLAAGLAVA